MKKTSKKRAPIYAGIFVVVVLAALLSVSIVAPKKNVSYSTLSNDPIIRTLSSSEIKGNLPDDARISLKVGETTYAIEGTKIKQGTISDPDLTISISDSAFNQKNDFCEMLRTANANNELSFETHKSKTSLAWKYRSFSGFLKCL